MRSIPRRHWQAQSSGSRTTNTTTEGRTGATSMTITHSQHWRSSTWVFSGSILCSYVFGNYRGIMRKVAKACSMNGQRGKGGENAGSNAMTTTPMARDSCSTSLQIPRRTTLYQSRVWSKLCHNDIAAVKVSFEQLHESPCWACHPVHTSLCTSSSKHYVNYESMQRPTDYHDLHPQSASVDRLKPMRNMRGAIPRRPSLPSRRLLSPQLPGCLGRVVSMALIGCHFNVHGCPRSSSMADDGPRVSGCYIMQSLSLSCTT